MDSVHLSLKEKTAFLKEENVAITIHTKTPARKTIRTGEETTTIHRQKEDSLGGSHSFKREGRRLWGGEGGEKVTRVAYGQELAKARFERDWFKRRKGSTNEGGSN